MEEPRRVSFPRGVWIALGIVGLLQVGGILAQLLVVSDQLGTNKDQRDIVRAQLNESRPVLEPTRRLTREQLEDLPRRAGSRMSCAGWRQSRRRSRPSCARRASASPSGRRATWR